MTAEVSGNTDNSAQAKRLKNINEIIKIEIIETTMLMIDELIIMEINSFSIIINPLDSISILSLDVLEIKFS